LGEAFLEFARRKDYAPDTYRNYRFYIMGFCEFRGFRLAAEIIPHDVTEWIAAKNWNDTTEYNAKRTVFRLFSWAKDEGLLAVNPLKGMRREKPEANRRCLLEHEYCSLLRGARRPFRAFLWSLMETGARPSELRRLKWRT
jgi:integrase